MNGTPALLIGGPADGRRVTIQGEPPGHMRFAVLNPLGLFEPDSSAPPTPGYEEAEYIRHVLVSNTRQEYVVYQYTGSQADVIAQLLMGYRGRAS